MLLLGASRPEAVHRSAPAEGLLAWLAAAEREQALVRLELERLSAGEIEQFSERVTHPEEVREQVEAFARWLYRETGGQPFYVTETIRALLQEGKLVLRPAGSGPPTLGFPPGEGSALAWTDATGGAGTVPPGVRAVIRNRLARLPATAFDLVVAAALLGQRFAFGEICRVAGLPRREALGDLDRLLATDLLAESKREDGLYTFTHDKIRNVVYEEAGQARRQLFHERALAYLVEKEAPAPQLAHHALGGRVYRDAFGYSLEAGEAAMALFAVAEARDHFEQARRILLEHQTVRDAVEPARRRHLYERLGRAHELLDEWGAAEAVYEEMVGMARRNQNRRLEVVGLNRLAAAKLLGKMDTAGAESLLEQARRVAEAGDDRHGLAESEWGLCLSKFRSLEAGAALAHGKRAITLAREVGDRELLAKSLNASGYAASGVHSWEKVEAYGEEATRLYAAAGNRALEADSLLLATFARINMGRAASGVAVAREALRICREIDNEWGETNSRNHLAAGLIELGAYEEAFAVIEALFRPSRAKDMPQQMAALTVRGLVRRALGDFEGALADMLRAERFLRQLGQPQMARVLSVHLCAAYGALEQWQAAHAQAQVALRTKDFGWYYAGLHYAAVIEALLHGGDEAGAAADIERLEEEVGRFARYRIVIERSRAALSRRRGEVEQAVAHLQAAVRQAETLSLPGENWSLLAELGRVYRSAGREQEADRAAAQAVAIGRELAAGIDDRQMRKEFLAAQAAALPDSE